MLRVRKKRARKKPKLPTRLSFSPSSLLRKRPNSMSVPYFRRFDKILLSDHAPPENSDADLAAFLAVNPEFESTRRIDRLRAEQYARLDDQRHVYLDYTGGSLYSEGQLHEHMALLRASVFGNPHSANPTSHAMTTLVEEARESVLRFFNASPDEYVAIFTANASGALKLVGESYPFGMGDLYLFTYDNHNSVNGIREYARARGARIAPVPLLAPEMRVDEDRLMGFLDRAAPGRRNLFAFPAQSNFSGVQHPLEWIETARGKGWDVLVDAAAFAPTNRLDLGRWKPDFVPISFYKIFGYPTGVGCLLARREMLAGLKRPWFAGGTVSVASIRGDRHFSYEGTAAFEDGTVNYLSLPAVTIGLAHISSIGVETIHSRVRCLMGWLIESLLALRHGNGEPLVVIYGPENIHSRGGAMALNFLDPMGRFTDQRRVEAEASKANISLRTGCFCNPGCGETALGLSYSELIDCFERRPGPITMDDYRLCMPGKSIGAVRVSLGLVSNFSDVQRFIQFAETFIDKPAKRE